MFVLLIPFFSNHLKIYTLLEWVTWHSFSFSSLFHSYQYLLYSPYFLITYKISTLLGKVPWLPPATPCILVNLILLLAPLRFMRSKFIQDCKFEKASLTDFVAVRLHEVFMQKGPLEFTMTWEMGIFSGWVSQLLSIPILQSLHMKPITNCFI